MSAPQVPVEVGSHPEGASPFGVLDLAGNAFEWTDSPFLPYPGFEPLEQWRGREKLKIAPDFNSNRKVIKGGGFNSIGELCRIDFRTGFNPADSDAGLGFRAARSVASAWDSLHARLAAHSPQVTSHDRAPGPPLTLSDLLLDAKQFFGHEVSERDAALGIVTAHRHVAFVPLFSGPLDEWLDPRTGLPSAQDPRRRALTHAPGDQVAEPVLGLLSTSEPLADPPADPGLYTVTFRTSPPPEGAEDEGGTWGRFRLHPWRTDGRFAVRRDDPLRPLALTAVVRPGAPAPAQRFVQRSVSGILNPLWLLALRDAEGRRLRLEFSIGDLLTTGDGLVARFHLDLVFERAWLGD
jgi:hypothetical protein